MGVQKEEWWGGAWRNMISYILVVLWLGFLDLFLFLKNHEFVDTTTTKFKCRFFKINLDVDKFDFNNFSYSYSDDCIKSTLWKFYDAKFYVNGLTDQNTNNDD